MPNTSKCAYCTSNEFVNHKATAENLGLLGGAANGAVAAGVGTKTGMILGATARSVIPVVGIAVGTGIRAVVGAASRAFAGKKFGKKVDKMPEKFHCKKCQNDFNDYPNYQILLLQNFVNL